MIGVVAVDELTSAYKAVINGEFGHRFKNPKVMTRRSRPILSPRRSLGSVIKLLTPAEEYIDEFNKWLRSIPPHILDLIFIVKRFYREEWGTRWREPSTAPPATN